MVRRSGIFPRQVWNESALDGGTGLWASGGGASTVYKQPAWQQGVSGSDAADGMRAVPDVSLSAANHDGYFMVEGGERWIVSGTSVAAPAFAGVMALVAEKEGGSGAGQCECPPLCAGGARARCCFTPRRSGNNSVPGVQGFTANGATYNLATGLGSVDGAQLVNGWSGSAFDAETPTSPTLTLTERRKGDTHRRQLGDSSVRRVTGGSFTGSVSFSVSGLPDGCHGCVVQRIRSRRLRARAPMRCCLRSRRRRGGRLAPRTVAVTATGDGLTATRNHRGDGAGAQNGCARFSLSLRVADRCRECRFVRERAELAGLAELGRALRCAQQSYSNSAKA